MSQSLAALPVPSAAPFEQQIYLRSPVGGLATTAILFAVLFGSFLGIAALEHLATIERTANSFAFSSAAWPALVLSLLNCAALGMQRYARVAEARDAPAFARILTGGMESAASVSGLMPPGTRLVRATVIGIVMGLAISLAVRIAESREGHVLPPGAYVWFVFVTTLLNVLFVRGVEFTRASNRAYAALLSAQLKIDLLRTDTLAVLGRSTARGALVWFVVSAVACLFFVGGDLNGLTIALIVSCAVMGLGMFVGVMSRIHRQIKGAKDAELEHIRRQIDTMRATMHEDGMAAARLHGMLAYEKRISDAPEWPFDQSTLVRVGASALILTVPWFGQAMAQYFVENIAKVSG
jgi:hypothetical protein